jgi:hypothetical protein
MKGEREEESMIGIRGSNGWNSKSYQCCTVCQRCQKRKKKKKRVGKASAKGDRMMAYLGYAHKIGMHRSMLFGFAPDVAWRTDKDGMGT